MKCSYCEKTIPIGETYLEVDIPQMKDEVFCCEKCAKARLESKLEEIYEDNAGEDVVEDPDPYSRYGVSRGDF